jgi:hypothetical protein
MKEEKIKEPRENKGAASSRPGGGLEPRLKPLKMKNERPRTTMSIHL